MLFEKKKKLDPMTVAQLIEALREMPQDATVVIEGCDCEDDAGLVVAPESKREWVTIGTTGGLYAQRKMDEAASAVSAATELDTD